MSSYISISSLSYQQKVFLRDDLTIKSKGNRYQKPEPIKCYSNVQGVIRIPFNYYMKLTGNAPNSWIEHNGNKGKFTGKLFEYQKEVTNKAESVLLANGSVILQLRTGFGKTIIFIYLACTVGYQSIFLYTRDILRKQIIKSIEDFSTMTYHVVGAKEKKREKNKNPRIVSLESADIIVCSNKLTGKIPKEVKQKIGLMAIDECHMFCTEINLHVMMEFTPRFCIFLTATFKKDNRLDRMIELISGEDTIIKYKNNIPFEVYTVHTGLHLLRDYVIEDADDVNKIWKYLLDMQTLSIRRTYIIISLILHLVSVEDRKVLAMTTRKGIASRLKNILDANEQESAIMIGNAKEYSDSKILIGTIGKIGTGFDEQAACTDFAGERLNTEIIINSNKSEPVFTQIVGRVLRSKDPKVYLIVDDDSISQRHYDKFVEWAQDNCGVFREFDIEVLDDIDVNGIPNHAEYDMYPEEDIETEEIEIDDNSDDDE